MSEAFEVSTVLPASPQAVYQAWLSSEAHTAFTGSPAEIDPTVGGAFTAWDRYISGRNIELEPYRRILQAWRTTEFAAGDPDSRLEVLVEPAGKQTRLTLRHSRIPDGQAESYESGWTDYYFKPMAEYFGG